MMGIQVGFILPVKSTTARGCLAVAGSSVWWNFMIGYVILGILVLLLLPFRNSFLKSLFDAMSVTVVFFSTGVFLVPALATLLTKLSLDFYRKWRRPN
jgi:hypothetical protein